MTLDLLFLWVRWAIVRNRGDTDEDICRGKVLVIDEAYGLHEGMYGARAIDTIVSKVRRAPPSTRRRPP